MWAAGYVGHAPADAAAHSKAHSSTGTPPPQPTSPLFLLPFKMNLLTRLVLGTALLALAMQSSLVTADQPEPLQKRRAELRARMLQERLARVAAYDKREYDFFNRDKTKRA